MARRSPRRRRRTSRRGFSFLPPNAIATTGGTIAGYAAAGFAVRKFLPNAAQTDAGYLASHVGIGAALYMIAKRFAPSFAPSMFVGAALRGALPLLNKSVPGLMGLGYYEYPQLTGGAPVGVGMGNPLYDETMSGLGSAI